MNAVTGEGCLDEARTGVGLSSGGASDVGRLFQLLPLVAACECSVVATSGPRLFVSQLERSVDAGVHLAAELGVRGIGHRFVYILRSDGDLTRHYVGTTGDVDSRLEWHNHGPSGHTIQHRPWSLVVVIEFPSEREAIRFERYLKSGSGRAFARRHFSG